MAGDAATLEEFGFLDASGTGHPECPSEDCGLYPYYGVAPHECYYKKGPEFRIGQSTLAPVEQWPAHFHVELEEGETAETVPYPSACGVYYCPTCVQGGRAPAATYARSALQPRESA